MSTVFIPWKLQKSFQKSYFWCHFRYVSSLYVFAKKTLFFGALKFKYLQNRFAKFKKWAHSEIHSLRAFTWCKNQIILIKFQFWLTSLSTVKYLGVLLDDHLIWSKQINYVTAKPNQAIGILSKLWNNTSLKGTLK